ncbi:MAG: multicopper oxidase family protein [Acidobacteria bacterium]|nr:multicopper oxidase family protein [Acidobacteriota bacterium]
MAAAMLAAPAGAATPGITGGAGTPQFSLSAEAAFISQPDGLMVYSWGYGCQAQPDGFAPAAIAAPTGGCPSMQIPGPTLIVKEGDLVKVTLTNNLPAAAGNTSILFPGFSVTATGGETGLLTQEAAPGGSVTYTFDTTGKAGTHSYYSGTQGDLQIEMGLYGAIVVLPATSTGCIPVSPTLPDGQTDYRLAASAYDHSMTCYEREYLFQFSEIDPAIHRQAEDQKDQACMSHAGCMNVRTENYHPAYFMINGRSMPDDMDPVYAVQYAHQPYNGNPHMHPGELVLLRIIGQGRWQHPFHEHGNHVRVLARDGNLLESIADPNMLAGPLLFTTTTTPGQAMDGIFYWTGKGLNWDVYGHKLSSVPCVTDANCPAIPSGQKCVTGLCDPSPCTPDADGYYTGKPNPIDHATVALKPNYYEWCGDHNRALEAHPAGDVGSGGPITLPDAGILANGPWYGGSPYLGPDAAARAVGPTPIPPSGTVANDPGSEAGFAFMWHSHNEREITTNNAFPGGMLMMMLVDPQAFPIDESK